ncbi:hypothetical protein V2G26_005690 [Clonostachys chloroleuca]
MLNLAHQQPLPRRDFHLLRRLLRWRGTQHAVSRDTEARLRWPISCQWQMKNGSYRIPWIRYCCLTLETVILILANIVCCLPRYGASGSDPQPIDDPSNLITLRRDLHHLFDTRRFTFVPKRDVANKVRCLTLHVFSPDDNNELIPLYHNRSPAPLLGISIEDAFARFAWTISSDQTVRFFKGMAEYAVLLFDPKTDEIKEAKLRALEVRTQVKIFDAFPKSRSASPKKRQRDPSAQDDEFWVVEEEDDASISSSWEPPRGRRRKRSWDYFVGDTTPELVQSFLSTDSDRSEIQGAVVERVKVEVIPHDYPDAAAIQRYAVPRKVTHSGMADRPCKRIDIESTKG